MNAIGIFAGRGDVLVAMALALIIGIWLGYKIKEVFFWISNRRSK